MQLHLFSFTFKPKPSHYLLGAVFSVACLATPLVLGQNDGDYAPPAATIQRDASLPPIAQTLVPEGVFAMQLADALKLGAPADSAKAEAVLSNVGIEPKNGWISEYPVTPAVLGEIGTAVTEASATGKIAFTKEQAMKLLGDIKAKLGIDVNAGTNPPADTADTPGSKVIYSYTDTNGMIYYTNDYNSIPKQYQKNAKIISSSGTDTTSGGVYGNGGGGMPPPPPGPQYIASPNPDELNGYYYDQGPPMVTYYSPPDPYTYLYSWVPYPFWSTGFYFTGFYILNNFHRQVTFNRQTYFVAHHSGGGEFSQPLHAGPVNQNWSGYNTPDGRNAPHWFANANAQTSARAIVMLNQNHSAATGRTAVSQGNAWAAPMASTGNYRTTSNAAPVERYQAPMDNRPIQSAAPVGARERTPTQTAYNPWNYIPSQPRYTAPPASLEQPAFREPRQFGGNSPEQFHNTSPAREFQGGGFQGREFQGGGNFANHGGAFAGGHGGGGRR